LKVKVLILGSRGLIGHQVYDYLKYNSNFELHNISSRTKLQEDTILVDARNEKEFIEKIISIRPQYIVNCIGLLISKASKNLEDAIFINSYIPHKLTKVADKINAKLIHLSTDCVFSGDKKTPYIESDDKDGIDNYAKTKGLGEVEIDGHLTIRTSVIGPELKESDSNQLFQWFMNQSGSINGFSKFIWSGVTSIELAKAVKWSIDNNLSGLYHITNNSSISKYELLKLFQKYTKKDINIIQSEVRMPDKSFIDTRLLINYKIPSYDQMVKEMIEYIKDKDSAYHHYRL